MRTYDEDHNLAFKMKIVDGEAKGNHDTPMFVRTMRYMIFRPYWNLPISIIKKELMKHINSGGAAYLERNDYEVTDRSGQPVSGWTAADLEHGRYMVRQKPGPKNSLGLVKFMFPNEYDIYMHSTPEMNLFNLTRRDRSHGCIRLMMRRRWPTGCSTARATGTPTRSTRRCMDRLTGASRRTTSKSA